MMGGNASKETKEVPKEKSSIIKRATPGGKEIAGINFGGRPTFSKKAETVVHQSEFPELGGEIAAKPKQQPKQEQFVKPVHHQ